MRLWTVHPRYLDKWGLCGLWREALLAQRCILADPKTISYQNHPQLKRFLAVSNPTLYIGSYLWYVADFAFYGYGYQFDKSKIQEPVNPAHMDKLDVLRGQVEFEFDHLQRKLIERSRSKHKTNLKSLDFDTPSKELKVHPLFRVIDGDEVEYWEKGGDRQNH